MALEDPFFVVKDEVLKALLKTRDLFESWRMGQEGLLGLGEGGEGGLLRSAEEQEWATTELRNSLRSIEWDLEDLDDTVQIVEKNPAKFRIEASELAVRKAFIQQTRDEVNHMKDRAENPANLSRPFEQPSMDTIPLASPSTPTVGAGVAHSSSSHGFLDSGVRGYPGMAAVSSSALQPPSHAASLKSALGGSVPGRVSGGGGISNGNTKYSRLPNESSPSHTSLSNSNSQMFLQQQLAAQDRLVAGQDSRLDLMSETMGTLRNVSGAIGQELDEQAVMLDEFGTEIENAESKLDATMRKMAKVLHMANDRRQWMAIGALSSAMLIIIILLFGL